MMLSPSRRFGLTANGQAMAVVHESISRPSALAKVFAGDNLPCTFQKRLKNLEGTFLQFDLSAGEVEFARAKIRFNSAKWTRHEIGAGWGITTTNEWK